MVFFLVIATTVTVDGIDQITLNRTYGKLYLVDLAGSERVSETNSTGDRLVEAQYINKVGQLTTYRDDFGLAIRLFRSFIHS